LLNYIKVSVKWAPIACKMPKKKEKIYIYITTTPKDIRKI